MLTRLVHRLKTAAFVGPVFLLICLPLTGCGEDSKKEAAPEKLKVVVAEAKEVQVPRTATFNGTLSAKETVEVRARVSGYLAEKLFEEGSVVQAGQLLYKLDDRDLKAALDTAEANTAKTKATWENEDITKNRMVALADKGAISLQQRDNAVAKAAEALAAYQAAQAEEEKASVNLGYATITAPTTGFISRSNVEVGSNVDAGSATLMTTIYNIDPIRVEFSITDKEYASIQQSISANKGQREAANFTMLLGDGKVPYAHPGVLEMADPVIDSKTNTMGIRVDFPNPEHYLRPGMYVNLVGTMGTLDVVVVPEVAVMDQAGTKAVYAVDAQNKVVAAPVEIGESVGDDRIITKGLTPGQKVIVEGLVMARPGMTVEVVTNTSATESGSGK